MRQRRFQTLETVCRSVDKGMGFEKLTIDIEHAVMNRCKDLIGVEARRGRGAARTRMHCTMNTKNKFLHGIMNCSFCRRPHSTCCAVLFLALRIQWNRLAWALYILPPLPCTLASRRCPCCPSHVFGHSQNYHATRGFK